MKFKNYFLTVFILSFTLSNAQQQNCNCSEAFETLVVKIEKEYPGFREKTKHALVYNSLKANLAIEAETAKEENCLPVLQKYVDFFKDKHIWILANQPTQTSANEAIVESEIFKIDLKKFKKEIINSKDALEGIWKNDSYEIGIKKINSNEYVGFIISADPKYWKTKEIKFKLLANNTYEYKMQDHSIQKGTYTMDEKGLLYLKEIVTEFVKQTPNPAFSKEEIADRINELNGFYCKQITPKTVLLKLSNFSYPFVETIENLIEKNKHLLQNNENLIIDLRGNGGGTTDAFQKLLPYIVTNPIRYTGAEHLSTPSFINSLKRYNASLTDKEKYSEQIAENEKRIKLLEANPGKYVNFSGEIAITQTLIPEVNSPKQIVFLIDNHVASSGEALLLIAKQSKKVKTIGIPTSGVLDYANAYFFDDFICSNYKLLLPTFRSLRLPDYPIDNIGIQPDIYMDKTIEDWVKFAVDYLENSL